MSEAYKANSCPDAENAMILFPPGGGVTLASFQWQCMKDPFFARQITRRTLRQLVSVDDFETVVSKVLKVLKLRAP